MPLADVDRCSVYVVAPVTASQLIEIDWESVAVAVSPVGVAGEVVAETEDEYAELPVLLLELTS